jgi:hypothetical protein
VFHSLEMGAPPAVTIKLRFRKLNSILVRDRTSGASQQSRSPPAGQGALRPCAELTQDRALRPPASATRTGGGAKRAQSFRMRRETRFRMSGAAMTPLLPNPLRMFRYARGGGVSRVAKGADCKSAGLRLRRFESYLPHQPGAAGRKIDAGCRASPTFVIRLPTSRCGCSSMVEQQPSKLMTRVRFPSPAPSLFNGLATLRPCG